MELSDYTTWAAPSQMWDDAVLWEKNGPRTCLLSEHLSSHIKLAQTLRWPQTRHHGLGWLRRGLSSRPVVCAHRGQPPKSPAIVFDRANGSSAGMCFVSRFPTNGSASGLLIWRGCCTNEEDNTPHAQKVLLTKRFTLLSSDRKIICTTSAPFQIKMK